MFTALENYLQDKKIPKTDFAQQIGISRGFLHAIISGTREPGRKTIKKIYKATQGQVTANDYFHGCGDEDVDGA
jgi:predicted transcriptional regulator